MTRTQSLLNNNRPLASGLLRQVHPNPARIAAMAIGAALHIVALMLLIRPMQLQFAPAVRTLVVVPDRIDVEPPLPPPVLIEKIERPSETPPIVRDPRPITQPPAANTSARIETATLETTTAETADAAFTVPQNADPAPPANAEPVSGVQLQYAVYPAPDYPAPAARDGAEGTVLLQVLVDVDGRPLQVDVRQSSGNRYLDRAAREQVLRRWTFQPALRNGVAVQAIGLVPIHFSLK